MTVVAHCRRGLGEFYEKGDRKMRKFNNKNSKMGGNSIWFFNLDVAALESAAVRVAAEQFILQV